MDHCEPDARYPAELIAYLARLARSAEDVGDLNSAQRSALRFFASATRTSRTVTAFAAYNVTTRGTASQTIKGLVDKGLLTRTPSPTDRRVIQIGLTPEGRALYEQDPFVGLVRAVSELPEADGLNLTTILEALTTGLAADRQKRQFGLCAKCLHLKKTAGLSDEETTHFCRLIKEPLSAADLTSICMDYRAAVGQD